MDSPYDKLDFEQAAELVKKRQRFERKPKTSSNLIAQLMARKGYGQQQASEELAQAWDVVIPSNWRSQTRVGNLQRGVLDVIVGSSMLNQRLEFEKKKLLSQLQQQLPHQKIRDLRFRIGNL